MFNQSIRFVSAHLPILPISTANPITFPILLRLVVLGVFASCDLPLQSEGMVVAVWLRGGGGGRLLKNVLEAGLGGLTFAVDFLDAGKVFGGSDGESG